MTKPPSTECISFSALKLEQKEAALLIECQLIINFLADDDPVMNAQVPKKLFMEFSFLKSPKCTPAMKPAAFGLVTAGVKVEASKRVRYSYYPANLNPQQVRATLFMFPKEPYRALNGVQV